MYVFHVMHVYKIYEGLTKKGDIVRIVLENQNTLHQVVGVFFNSLPSKFESGLSFFSHQIHPNSVSFANFQVP